MDENSFTFIADHMPDESNPSILFFPISISTNLNFCFQSNKQQISDVGSGLDAAIQASRTVESADDVTRIRMVRGKVTSVTAN